MHNTILAFWPDLICMKICQNLGMDKHDLQPILAFGLGDIGVDLIRYMSLRHRTC